MAEPIRVVFVDDHAIFRVGLAQSLAMAEGVEVVAEGSSAADAVSLVALHRPDILLLDLWMQRTSSVDQIPSILDASPATQIVVLTASEDNQDVQSAMSAGAAGYVMKETSPTDLVSIIRSIKKGETYLSSRSLAAWLISVKDAAKQEDNLTLASSLSARELAVLKAVVEGKSNAEVAQILGISVATVKYHLARVFAKLGVRNRVEAAMLLRTILDRQLQ